MIEVVLLLEARGRHTSIYYNRCEFPRSEFLSRNATDLRAGVAWPSLLTLQALELEDRYKKMQILQLLLLLRVINVLCP